MRLVLLLLGITPLFAVPASDVDTDPPVISLDLRDLDAVQIASDPSSGEPCHTKAEWLRMGNPEMAETAPESCDMDSPKVSAHYAKKCQVLTDTKAMCPEPQANAFDHHDGILDVRKEVEVLVLSDPHELPRKVNTPVPDVDYQKRGEWMLRYDAADANGNDAEQVTFVMVMVDHVSPVINPLMPSPYTAEACAPGSLYAVAGDGCTKLRIPHMNAAVDNYDGDVSNLIQLSWVFEQLVPQSALLSGAPIDLDTSRVGQYSLTYIVSDFADIFGKDNLNNTKSMSAVVNIVDTTPPQLYCKHQKVVSKLGQFTKTLGFIKATSAIDVDTCASACESQQWSEHASKRCEYFEYSIENALCSLYDSSVVDEYESVMEDGQNGGTTLGFLVQCQNPNVVECGAKFDDPGAVCVDSRESYVDGIISPTVLTPSVEVSVSSSSFASSACQNGKWAVDTAGNLKSHQEKYACCPAVCEDRCATNACNENGLYRQCCMDYIVAAEKCATADDAPCWLPVTDGDPTSPTPLTDGTLVGDQQTGEYHMMYTCTDSEQNEATTVTREVSVVDTSKPSLTLNGTHIQQIACGMEDNAYTISEALAFGAGYTSHDACDGQLHPTSCSVTMHEETCPGDFMCGIDGTSHCNGGKREALNVSSLYTVGTWAIKYQCADASGNAVAKCRTIINVPTEKCETDASASRSSEASNVAPTVSPTAPPPIDCKVSTWASWGNCTEHCGEGIRQRVRELLNSPAFGGVECPALQEQASCNVHHCPLNCTSNWLPWSSCSRESGTGTQTRQIEVIRQEQFGGEACPFAEQRTCATEACAVDCALSPWGEWSPCTQTCGTGTQSRSRSILQPPLQHGKDCDAITAIQECNRSPCAIACTVSAWSEWGECSQECGGGTKSRVRRVQTPSLYEGTPCPVLSEAATCYTKACPVDCEHTWLDWTPCSKSCGSGVTIRSLVVLKDEEFDGVACPVAEEKLCNTNNCATDCTVSGWGDWSECSASCGVGSGSKSRSRSVRQSEAHGGVTCPSLESREDCNSFECPVDCVVEEWGDWEQCSTECGGGVQARQRKIEIEVHRNGLPCPLLREVRECNPRPCPADCVYEYLDWAPCSRPCGGGTANRKLQVISAPQDGGKECPGDQAQMCNTQACPTDCIVSGWGQLSTCTKTCAKGSTTRSRSVLRDGAHGGTDCPSLKEHSSCNANPCPINCVTSQWSGWGMCS